MGLAVSLAVSMLLVWVAAGLLVRRHDDVIARRAQAELDVINAQTDAINAQTDAMQVQRDMCIHALSEAGKAGEAPGEAPGGMRLALAAATDDDYELED